MTIRTLDEALGALASRGDAVALRRRTEFRSFPLSGAAAAARALRIAAVLHAAGVRRGDRVLIRAPNGPDWGLSLLAVLRLGAVAVPLDARASAEFTARIAERVRARAAVLSRAGAPGPSDLPALLVEEIDARTAAERGPDPPPPGNSPGDTAEILFTSGTTGAPKGVILTHGNVASNVAALARVERFSAGDAMLSLLPLSHMFEQTVGFFLPLTAGTRVVYLDTLKPSAVVHALEEERITAAVLVPRILQGLREGIERETAGGLRGAWFRTAWALAGPLGTAGRRFAFRPLHRRFGGRVRFFLCGGAPLERDLEEFWGRLGFPILQGYGLTETSPVLTCGTTRARRAGSVGRFLDGVEHRLGADGELQVRGPSVFGGYFEDGERTREALRDGWFHTGDLGEVRDGFLHLKGRSKDLIKSPGGLNVYPDDVEAALRHAPGVRDACVFGLPGPRGEEVVAALLPAPGAALDPRAAAAFANARLEEGRGVGRAVVWPGEDFPRTPTLKVQKFKVREAVRAGKASEEAAAAGAVDPVLELVGRVARRPAAEIGAGHRLGPDLGMDSLDLVDLVSALEERFHLDLDEGEVAPETRVEELRAMVADRRPAPDDRFPLWRLRAPASWLRAAFRGVLLYPVFRLFARVEARGAEHLRGLEGPLILAANHTSHLDVPALLLSLPRAMRRRTAVAAWKEYFEPEGAGLLGRIFLGSLRQVLLIGIPMVPISQARAFRRSLRNVGRALDAGWNVVFFPEGERSTTGTPKPFRQGIGIVAGVMRARIVPVRVRGFDALMPRGRFLPRRGTGSVTFGPPLDLRGEDPAALARAVERAVNAL